MADIIEWNNLKLVIGDFKHTHANGGRLSKLWVEDINSGRIFMVKANSPFKWEPFSEKIAYIVGKNLGIDVLEYDLIPASLFKGILHTVGGCKYVSICEKIDKENYSITSIAEIKRAQNIILKESGKHVSNKEVMYSILPKEYIDTMLLFDAIIGNRDRHYGNVHLLRGVDGSIVGASILDNGASMLSLNNILLAAICGRNIGKYFNKSYTTAAIHDKQLIDADAVNNINFNIPVKTMKILEEIQPVLDIMPKFRARMIKNYLTYRLHKYLGMMKYDDNSNYFKKQSTSQKAFIEKEWSGELTKKH